MHSSSDQAATTPIKVVPFVLELRRRHAVADGTMAFHFAKPEGFTFVAGQSTELTLVDPPESDAEGNTRTFTIACAPTDPDIVIATRLRDTAFKRSLQSVAIGTCVSAEAPSGDFVLHDDVTVPAVFLAGGIGITPCRSIIRDLVRRGVSRPVWLFYSNHRPEDAVFFGELQQDADASPWLHFVPTMTDLDRSSREWHGAVGPINRDLLSRHIPIREPIYYLSGPPGMVKAMRQMLAAAMVRDEIIRTDEFDGY